MADQVIVVDMDDRSAKSGADRVNSYLKNIEATASEATKSVGGIFSSFTDLLLKTAELAGAVYILQRAIGALTVGIGSGTMAMAQQAAVMDRLVATSRVLETVYRPTLFTSVALGAIMATQAVAGLTIAQGRLIDQQVFASARYSIPYAGVEFTSNLSRVSGLNSELLSSAVQELQKRLSAGDNSTDKAKASLTTLGVNPVFQRWVLPDTIQQTVAGFQDISDPVTKARTAISLFGEDVAGKILPQLNAALAESAEKVAQFNLGFSEDSRQKISAFKNDIEDLSQVFGGVKQNIRGAWEQLKEFIAVGTANSYDFLKRIYGDPDNWGLGGTAGKHLTLGGMVPDTEPTFLQQLNSAASAPNLETAQTDTGRVLKALLSENQIRTGSASTKDLSADVQRQIAENAAIQSGLLPSIIASQRAYNQTPNGVNAALSRAQSEQSKVFEKITRGKALTIEDISVLSSAQPEIKSLFGQQQGFEASRFQLEQQLSSAESRRAATSYGPLGSIASNYETDVYKATHRVASDMQGNPYVQQIALGNQTRDNLEKTFQAKVLEYQKNSIAESMRLYRQEFEQRLHWDEEVFTKRNSFVQETLDLERKGLEIGLSNLTEQDRYSRDLSLGSIDLGQNRRFGAPGYKTNGLQGQLADEAQRGQINRGFIESSSADQVAALERAQQHDIGMFNRTGLSNTEINDRISAIEKGYAAQASGVQNKYLFDIAQSTQQETLKSQEIIRSAQEKDFDSIKGTFSSLLDVLTSKTKDLGAAVGQFFRDAALKPLKEIASAQLSRLAYSVFGGGPVSFAQSGGPGGVGSLRNLFGGLGMGAPQFSGQLSAAAPAAVAPQFLGSFGTTNAAYDVLPGTSADSPSMNYFSEPETSGGGVGGTLISSGLTDQSGLPFARTPVGYLPSLAVGGGGMVAGSGGGVRGGILSQANLGKVLTNPKALLGSIYNSTGMIQLGNGMSADAAGISGSISASLGGGTFGNAIGAIGGGLAGFASSPAGGALGGSLALQGILGKNPGGVAQTAETVGGGALLGANIGSKVPSLGIVGGAGLGAGIGLMANGFQRKGLGGELESIGGGALAGGSVGFAIGGPIGGLIGLGVGAVVGAVSGLVGNFVQTRIEQIQAQIKKLYGLNISTQYAQQIDQISKSAYGGSISAAIRSPQVQQMLSIYSEATGQKFQFSNQPRPLYLTESGGNLTQQATYVNGQAYSYSGNLPVYGGVQTSSLPQYNGSQQTLHSPGNPGSYTSTVPMSIQLDGPATTAVLQGQIANSPQQVAQGYSKAQSNSFDRRANAARILNPSLLIT